MSKEDTQDLITFLKPFSNHEKEIALWLREFVWKLYPGSNELIYDNYNALAFGWSLSDRLGDTFCSIAVFGKEYVHFGFYRGADIPDYDKILLGNGSQYRYIKVFSKKDFPKEKIKRLVEYAYTNSVARMKIKKQVLKGATITKSISAKKKRPGMEAKKKSK